jgi:hypothetical protein
MACKNADGRSAGTTASGKSGGKDMDRYDFEPESRAAGVERNAAPSSATRASAGPSEFDSSVSGGREGKAHRVAQRPFVIRRLG